MLLTHTHAKPTTTNKTKQNKKNKQATIVYRRDAVGAGGFFATRLKSPQGALQAVLAMPRAARVRASSSAWWAAPGPLQPGYVGAGRPYKDGFDATRAFPPAAASSSD